jgi:hypothetical protein
MTEDEVARLAAEAERGYDVRRSSAVRVSA